MNRWVYAGIGEFFGVILFTTRDEFYGVDTAGDIAEMIGFGIPFAAIGYGIGVLIEKLLTKKN